MTPGARDFWTVIVFYRGGNWLAWTYELYELAENRLDGELTHPGSMGGVYSIEVRL